MYNFNGTPHSKEDKVTPIFGFVTFGLGLSVDILAAIFAIFTARKVGKRLAYIFIYVGVLIFADLVHLFWNISTHLETTVDKTGVMGKFGCFFFKICDSVSHTLPFHVLTALCFDLSGIYTPVPIMGKYLRPLLALLFMIFVSFIINCQFLLSVHYQNDNLGACAYKTQAAFIRLVAFGVFYHFVPLAALLFLHIFRFYPPEFGLRSLGGVTLALTLSRWAFWLPFWAVSLKFEAELKTSDMEWKIVSGIDQIGLIIDGLLILILIYRFGCIHLPPPLPRTSKEEKELLALGILQLRQNYKLEEMSVSEMSVSVRDEPDADVAFTQ